MPNLKFSEYTTSLVVIPGMAKNLAIANLRSSTLVFQNTLTYNLSKTRVATSLSADSNNLFSKDTCMAMVCDYLCGNGVYWAGHALLEKNSSPANWKAQSQFVSIAITLGIVDALGPNFHCAFRDFDKYLGIPSIRPRWEGNAPDYVIWNLSQHPSSANTFAVLECKGVNGTIDKSKFNKYKLQTLNFEAQFPVKKSVLAYSLFSPSTTVEVRWFNASKPKAKDTKPKNFSHHACLTAFLQLTNQLRYIGDTNISSLFLLYLRGEISTRRFVADISKSIGSKEEEFNKRELAYADHDRRLHDNSLRTFNDRITLRRFAVAAIMYKTKPKAALQFIEKAAYSVLSLALAYRSRVGFETEVYPTGICFTRATSETGDVNTLQKAEN